MIEKSKYSLYRNQSVWQNDFMEELSTLNSYGLDSIFSRVSAPDDKILKRLRISIDEFADR